MINYANKDSALIFHQRKHYKQAYNDNSHDDSLTKELFPLLNRKKSIEIIYLLKQYKLMNNLTKPHIFSDWSPANTVIVPIPKT